MSFLGNVLGSMMGNNPEHQGVAQALLAHLQDGQSGGLGGLLDRFRSQGLSQQADSWVSTGENQPISPDQAEQGLGSGQLEQLAARAGVSPTVAKVALAAVLPMIVDRLTPNGQVPEHQGLMQKLASMLPRAS